MDKPARIEISDIEDGEIINDEFDELYTPLERPTYEVLPSVKVTMDHDGDKNLSSEESDSSDSDDNTSHSKKKRRTCRLTDEKPKDSKLKIWCNVLESESVISDLSECNLDVEKMKFRSVKPHFNKNGWSKNNGNFRKRNHTGNFIEQKTLMKKEKEKIVDDIKSESKEISPLSNKEYNSDEELAMEIAKKLNEVKHDLILRAVKIAGKEKVLEIFEETRKVEREGGMVILNGTRRRTSGGVFFNILKTYDLPAEKLKEIFLIDKKETMVQKRKVQRQIRRQIAAKLHKATIKKETDVNT